MHCVSNPGDKFKILVEGREQICPVFFFLFRTFYPGLENNESLLTTLTYVVRWGNCQSNISKYG